MGHRTSPQPGTGCGELRRRLLIALSAVVRSASILQRVKCFVEGPLAEVAELAALVVKPRGDHERKPGQDADKRACSRAAGQRSRGRPVDHSI